MIHESQMLELINRFDCKIILKVQSKCHVKKTERKFHLKLMYKL